MSTASASAAGTLVERMGLKTLVESCLVLEEGVASAKDIEIGMMMGAGILPGPFSRADEAGLDTILEQLERAEREWGPAFEPPTVLRRLVAQGRLGKKSGQGFFPYPQPDAGDQRETVLVETRGRAIAWLTGHRESTLPRPCAMIPWARSSQVAGAVIASSNIFTFARLGHQGCTNFSRLRGRDWSSAHGHALDGVVPTVTVAASTRLRSALVRAGDACDSDRRGVRHPASRDNLGSSPLRRQQRLPRWLGEQGARGTGAATRSTPTMRTRRAGHQSCPTTSCLHGARVGRGGREAPSRQRSTRSTTRSRRGARAEAQASGWRSARRTQGGISAFSAARACSGSMSARSRAAARLAAMAAAEARGRATARRVVALRIPLPHRGPGCGRTRPMEVAHRRCGATPSFWRFTAIASLSPSTAAQRRTCAGRAGRRGCRGLITQTSTACTGGGHAAAIRCTAHRVSGACQAAAGGADRWSSSCALPTAPRVACFSRNEGRLGCSELRLGALS